MQYYFAVKHIHVSFVVISLAFFALRGFWMWTESGMLQKKWVKIVPHIVDTGLLAAGIFLAVVSHQSPTTQPWLGAKMIALVAYIVLGTLALKRAKTKQGKRIAFVAAVLCAAYMVGAAVTRSPWLAH